MLPATCSCHLMHKRCRVVLWHALQAGDSPLQMGPKREDSVDSNTNPLSFLFNFIVGTLAGSYYFVLPIVMWLRHRILLLVGR